MKSKFILIFILIGSFQFLSSQDKKQNKFIELYGADKTAIESAVSPTKAAFYSGLLPGLGQAYNKKYWKVPIVYALLGYTIYISSLHDEQYIRYRNAYKSRLAGFTDDEFYGDGTIPVVPTETLIRAQQSAQENRDEQYVYVLLIYFANIIDANVDAHLKDYNISQDLTFKPILLNFNNSISFANIGLSIIYDF